MTRQLFDKGHYKLKPKCHTKHPVLKLGSGEIVGGSCGSPRDGFDIYIGFCFTMTFQHQPYPWETKDDPIVEFQYRITDMAAPQSPKEFKKLIEWVAYQLKIGKRIHVGCIGGHGRTGTFLAALVAHMKTTDDPIRWVRKNHCKKAVESKSQVKFLVKHFGCKTAKPTKIDYPKKYTDKEKWRGYEKGQQKVIPFRRQQKKREVVRWIGRKGSIWG